MNQSAEQSAVTEEVLRRAIENGAAGFALTGSTARAKRTSISDLDYHVIGRRPRVLDLPPDVDVMATAPDRLVEKARAGDDFVQWTVRHGCILDDRGGLFRATAVCIIEEDLWPDGQAKLERLPELIELASRLIASGYRDAAQDQVRAALTAASRGLLLLRGEFPLARDELAQQLDACGARSLARAMRRSIHEELDLSQLREDLAEGSDSSLAVAL